ncbi:branched-chain amino acid ABC transporter permease [Mesorhizobium sp. M1E.F.Ca.ET.045.02.1.1]|uniref:branched-chain amino acid ABC transporter permease n=1 Tax=unclassified Mesorhizobium TaxID=325217 RepID=UPI000F76355C|nr:MULTISPECIES: branched-chain amino acid ABC transporter permease [unclassified Mesorhizobium]AZO20469.1 branched-chain amino acid ABC transporter permease [Mesorhizobium sp. M1E.F.Ca.ET.045.02.1.1]RUW86028.1 branched-chain amino acid ABC transporter permease [Mesorhizobium sp. M1E.F.Ca.ET.063.01.1.1]
MKDVSLAKTYAPHIGIIALLFVLNFVLPDYHQGLFARIMTLAVFAMGYNLLFGYVGLLSLGHAMFFSAGLYGAGLTVYHLGWGVPESFIAGVACGALLALVIGLLALRTSGVAFMIVTMMFAQVFYLLILYFAAWTGGDQGLVIQQTSRALNFGSTSFDLTNPTVRYMSALALFSVVLFITLAVVRSRFGRVLVAIRENEERTRMLGYDTVANKLAAVVLSGTICAASGAAYALLFGYIGSSFASVQYSILPLLWVLLGGAATTLGPLIGTLFMYYVTDITSGFTSAYLLIVGVALILLVLFAPKGILGSIRQRWLGWLP